MMYILVSSSQNAFVYDRQTLDKVLTANNPWSPRLERVCKRCFARLR